LAYIDIKKRLRSLVPIREYIQQCSPPSQFLMRPLRKHFHSLLELYKKYNGAQISGIIGQITLNLGNLHQVLYRGLHKDNPDVADSIQCIISVNSFHRITGRSSTALMDHISPVLTELGDQRLGVHFIVEVLQSHVFKPTSNPELLIAQGVSYCNQLDDRVLECECATTVPVSSN
jgi:hypothetical protein